MIELTFSGAVFLYLFMSMVVILFFWALFEHDKKFKRYIIEEKYIWECTICKHIYVDSMHDMYSTCPRCESYNQHKEARMDLKNAKKEREE